jgi:hypothetical protein
VTLIGSSNLTGERRIAAPGMAGFSGEGPLGAHCSDCLFFDRASKRRRKGVLWARCHRYTQLMGGQSGPAFPSNMAACKYFELAPNAARTWASPLESGKTPSRFGWRDDGSESAEREGDHKMDMKQFAGDTY